MGELLPTGGREGEGSNGSLLASYKVLGLHPVGEKDTEPPLRLCPASPEEVGGMAAGGNEPSRGILLGQGEKKGMGRDGTAPGKLQLVHDPGQHQPLIGIGGELGKELGLIHHPSPRWQSCRR